MKIKQEHYQHMLAAIAAAVERHGKDKLAEHRCKVALDPRVKDAGKRYRWDLMRAANILQWQCDTLYAYANDDHIDTALRSIVQELNI